MFCSLSKSSKSRKSASHQSSKNIEVSQNINNSNSNNNNNNATIVSNNNTAHGVENQQHATGNLRRYVTVEFHAVAADELSVLPGDVVLHEFVDNSSDGNWSHVLCLKTHKRGFVPSEILSTEPFCKKKLPRSIANPSKHLHETHHVSDQQTTDGDNIHLHQHQLVREQQTPFIMPQSLQGSSGGKQSFQKYNDLRHLSPSMSAKCHKCLHSSEPHYGRFNRECRQFHRESYGLFMVSDNFVAREENDLSVIPGDYVTLLNKEDEDWYWVRRNCDLAEGFVPSRFIHDYELVKSFLEKGNSTVTMESSNHNDFHTYINHRPDKGSLPTDQQSSLIKHI